MNDHPPTQEMFSMTVTPDNGPDPRAGTTPDALAGVTLLFVYNADSGVMNSLKDYVHKSVSPATYSCNLCALTYGSLGMKGTWAQFVDGLGVPVEFLHRDELRQRHIPEEVVLPAVLLEDGPGISVLITAQEINELWTLDELKGLVSTNLRELREKRARP